MLGHEDKENNYPSPMKWDTVPICSQDVCDKYTIEGNLHYNGTGQLDSETLNSFKGTVFCAGDYRRPLCLADYGGPLIANINNKFTLVSGVEAFQPMSFNISF